MDRAIIEHLEADEIIDRETIANLKVALVSARRIGAAIGIVMADLKATEEQAFQLLSRASQDRNRTLPILPSKFS